MRAKRVFIDTNLWLYGLTASQVAIEQVKHDCAVALFERVMQDTRIMISIQVVNECHWNLTRKFGYTDQDVREMIERNMLSIAHVHPVTLRMYRNAFAHRQRYTLSFWDSLIMTAALEAECEILYSEDMQHGQLFEQHLKIVNPFVENAPAIEQCP